MTYDTAQARQQLLDAILDAAAPIGSALASLGEAYEALDENTADRLERELFRPVQMAYGRIQRTCTQFAERYSLTSAALEQAQPGHPSQGARGFLDGAMDAVAHADAELATLQDSMLPVELGDAELRAGLAEVRELLGDVRDRARQLVRVLGR